MSLAVETLRTGPADSRCAMSRAVSLVQQAMLAALYNGSYALGLFDASHCLVYSNDAFRKDGPSARSWTHKF